MCNINQFTVIMNKAAFNLSVEETIPNLSPDSGASAFHAFLKNW